MNIINKYLQEELNEDKKFIIHIHDPRNTSKHFDLRMMHPYDDKILMSFAFGTDFDKQYDKKIIGVRTKDHNIRWLDLKSYRLNTFDEGTVRFINYTRKFMELEFDGNKIKGKYKLFQVKSEKRDDRWLLIKSK